MDPNSPDPSSSDDGSECHLLELPAELRNRIYELALHEDKKVQITASGFSRPGLLSTCRQIRSEALKIFYYQNAFVIPVSDYNSDISLSWSNHVRELKLSRDRMKEKINQISRQPNWSNLLQWLRRRHANVWNSYIKEPSKLRALGKGPDVLVVGGMFSIVDMMRPQPWSQVEGILLEQRVVLETLNPGWASN